MIGLCSSSGKGWLGNGHPGQYNMTFDTKQQKGEKHGKNHWPTIIDKWCCFLTRSIHFLLFTGISVYACAAFVLIKSISPSATSRCHQDTPASIRGVNIFRMCQNSLANLVKKCFIMIHVQCKCSKTFLQTQIKTLFKKFYFGEKTTK